MKVLVPLRTVSALNQREHYMQRARRVKRERAAVGWMLATVEKPALPCVVTLTRVAPSSGLDFDGLVASMKGVVDAVATWLGVDDRHAEIVRYKYAQCRGPWGVTIAFEPMEAHHGNE